MGLWLNRHRRRLQQDRDVNNVETGPICCAGMWYQTDKLHLGVAGIFLTSSKRRSAHGWSDPNLCLSGRSFLKKKLCSCYLPQILFSITPAQGESPDETTETRVELTMCPQAKTDVCARESYCSLQSGVRAKLVDPACPLSPALVPMTGS